MDGQANITEFTDGTEKANEPETVRLKHLARINPTKSELSDLDPKTDVSFVPLEDFGTDGEIKDTETRPLEEVYDGYTYFREGDIAIAKITPSFENGKGAICRGLENGIGFGTTELHILRPREGVSTEFLWYVLRSKAFMDEAETAMRGVAGQQRIPTEFLENFRTKAVNPSKQRDYVQYLSNWLPEITAALSKSSELIHALKYRKPQQILSNIINHPRKGGKECEQIDWVDSIPKDSKETRLKFITNSIIDSEHKTAPERDGNYRIIRTTDVRNGKLRLKKAQQTDEEIYDEWTKRGVPEAEDLVFTREAPAGEVGIVPKDGKILLGQRTVLLKLDKEVVNPEYLNYYLQTRIVDWFIERSSQGSTVDHLNISDLKDLPIILPNVQTQEGIVKNIQTEEDRVDDIIDNLQATQSLLREKRQALITAAVTGQIDVPEVESEAKTSLQ